MNIWDLLRRNNPNQQQQQQSQQQQNIQQQQGDDKKQQQQQMQANPAGFPANGDDNNPFKELDVLSLLLDNSQQQQNQAPQFNIPRDKLQEIAGNINFLQNISMTADTVVCSGLYRQTERRRIRQSTRTIRRSPSMPFLFIIRQAGKKRH